MIRSKRSIIVDIFMEQEEVVFNRVVCFIPGLWHKIKSSVSYHTALIYSFWIMCLVWYVCIITPINQNIHPLLPLWLYLGLPTSHYIESLPVLCIFSLTTSWISSVRKFMLGFLIEGRQPSWSHDHSVMIHRDPARPSHQPVFGLSILGYCVTKVVV